MSPRRSLALLLLLTSVSACASKPPPKATNDVDSQFEAAVAAEKAKDQQKEPTPAASAPSGASGVAKNELPPFTGEQIRAATKPGRTYRYRVEVPGKPTRERTLVFAKADDSGAEIVTGAGSKRVGWTQLQKDSEWPKDKVTMHEEIGIKVPGGKFDCLVYELRGESGETVTYFFAKTLPGAPILFYTEQDGRRIKTTTLLQHVQGKDS